MGDLIKPAIESLQGSRRPTVAAEGGGVVIATQTSGMTVGEYSVRIETDGNAEKCAPGNAGPSPQVDLCAQGKGVVMADKHTDGKFDKMEFVVSRKKTS